MNDRPTVNVANLVNDELDSVDTTIKGSDPDGDYVSVSVSGVPTGLNVSGGRVYGQISYAAATVTTNWRTLKSRAFTVTVVAIDSHQARTSQTFRWTVVDNYRTMPNYIGKEGCAGCEGLPDVDAISTHVFDCAYDPTATATNSNYIYRQGVAPGGVIRWGQKVEYWYGSPTCISHVPKGW